LKNKRTNITGGFMRISYLLRGILISFICLFFFSFFEATLVDKIAKLNNLQNILITVLTLGVNLVMAYFIYSLFCYKQIVFIFWLGITLFLGSILFDLVYLNGIFSTISSILNKPVVVLEFWNKSIIFVMIAKYLVYVLVTIVTTMMDS
jgi:Zn-dependent membrane protease YugP